MKKSGVLNHQLLVSKTSPKAESIPSLPIKHPPYIPEQQYTAASRHATVLPEHDHRTGTSQFLKQKAIIAGKT